MKTRIYLRPIHRALACGALISLAAAVSGCVTSPPAPPASLLSDATSFLGRPSVSPYGQNWRISWTAETNGRRFVIYTAATSCDDRSGNLHVDSPPGRYEPSKQVVFDGPKAEDRLFKRLCLAGIPLVDTAERNQPKQANNQNSMSPESRAILMQHLLNQAMPPPTPSTETRCKRVPYSTTGEVVCNTK
jgi:hypothetical protein